MSGSAKKQLPIGWIAAITLVALVGAVVWFFFPRGGDVPLIEPTAVSDVGGSGPIGRVDSTASRPPEGAVVAPPSGSANSAPPIAGAAKLPEQPLPPAGGTPLSRQGAPQAMPARGAPPVEGQGSPNPSGNDTLVTEADLVALDRVKLSLRDFRTVMGENPTGTNQEITVALNGGNRRQSRLLPEEAKINGSGELVDRWGTPYFFHQLSKTDMEIRSAGPDRVLWTQDDLNIH